MWGRVDVRMVASAAVVLILLPAEAIAQAGPPGTRPSINRVPPQIPPASRRPQTDLLDLRDRHDTTTVTPLSGASSATLCVAGCGDGVSRTVTAAPQKASAFLGVVGPIEDAKLIKAAVIAAAPAAEPVTRDSGVITCLAGCDSSDRRVMQATGGPLPMVPRQPSIPQRFITAAAAPIITAPVVKAPVVKAPAIKLPVFEASGAKPPLATSAVRAPAIALPPVKLKRTLSAHAKRVEKKAKSSAARKSSGVQVAQIAKPSIPHIAAVGAPTPIPQVQPGQKPLPAVVKPQPIVSPKRPVAVNTSSDWFNKISRDQAAKKKADEAAQ